MTAVTLPATRSAPGDTAVTPIPTHRQRGFRGVLFFCLSALLWVPDPTLADGQIGVLADALCDRPPMTRYSLERWKRRSDYGLLLEELADHCPDVAMLFLDFEVGSIDDRIERPRHDSQQFIDPLDWPAPSDLNY